MTTTADSALLGSRSTVTDRGARSRWVDAVVLDGQRLGHYRRRLDRPDRPWVRVGTVTEQATGPGSLIRSRRALVAVVPEGDRTAAYRFEEGHRVAAGHWDEAAPGCP